jgi:hypothetical protein
MMKPIRFLSGLCFLLLALLSGCQLLDDPERTNDNWEPEIAIALLNTELNLEDILRQQGDPALVQSDSSRLLHLIFEEDLGDFTYEKAFELDSVTTTIADSAGVLFLIFPEVGGIREAHFDGGELRALIIARDTAPIRLFYSMPEFRQADGSVLQGDTLINGPGSLDLRIPMNGAKIIAPDIIGTFLVSARRIDTGARVQLEGKIGMQDLSYSYLEGVLLPFTETTPVDTVALDIPLQSLAGQVQWEQFDLELRIRNSFGIPMKARLPLMEVETRNRGILNLENDSLSQGFVINYPDTNEVGESKETLLHFDEENSNFLEVFSAFPEQLRFQFEGSTLFDENPGFVLDTSKIGLAVALDLPFILRSDGLLLSDTFALSVREWEQLDLLQEASLRIQTENGFPVELELQVVFLENEQAIDSMFAEQRQVLSAAPVDNAGRATELSVLNFDIPLSPDQLAKLNRTTHLLLRAYLQTTQQGSVPVSFYDDYQLFFKMGIKAK